MERLVPAPPFSQHLSPWAYNLSKKTIAYTEGVHFFTFLTSCKSKDPIFKLPPQRDECNKFRLPLNPLGTSGSPQ